MCSTLPLTTATCARARVRAQTALSSLSLSPYASFQTVRAHKSRSRVTLRRREDDAETGAACRNADREDERVASRECRSPRAG